jgi:hypothetical protein
MYELLHLIREHISYLWKKTSFLVKLRGTVTYALPNGFSVRAIVSKSRQHLRSGEYIDTLTSKHLKSQIYDRVI